MNNTKVVSFKKAIYSPKGCTCAFRIFLADYIKYLDFNAVCYDRDMWMCIREDRTGHDYIYTHIDEFKVMVKNPKRWCDELATKFHLKVLEDPTYYLGLDYPYSERHKAWKAGSSRYVKEYVHKIEADPVIGGKVYPHKTLPKGSHPEINDLQLFDPEDVRMYQLSIESALWANTFAHLDISHAV